MNAAITTELKTIGHWIGGESVRGDSGRKGPVYNPATGEQTSEVTFASVDDIDRAVATASDAHSTWRHFSLSKRAELFFRIYQLVDEHRDDLARLLTAEHGKVLSDAHGEVQRGIEVIEYVCGIPELLKGAYSEQASSGIDVYSIRQPLGVVAGITPFNFPVMVPMWMWAPAIACGNTFILKPSEKDPSASLLTAELLKEAGLPDGVFNVVQGDKIAVDAILQHPGIAAVSFVGSTPIARYVYENGTKAGKRVQALGGAKNHMIVLPDADIDMAADAAVSAGYGSAGERCMAVSVVVAVGDAADPLVDAIKGRLPAVKVGDGLDPVLRDGPPRHAGASRQGRVVPRLRARTGRDARGRRPRDRTGQRRLLPRRLVARRRDTGDGRVPRRDLRARALRRARADLRRGAPARQREPVRQRRGALHARRRRRPPVPVRRRTSAWSGSTSRSRCLWPTTPSAGGRARLFGDRHIYGPEGIDFYTRTKAVTSRWPDPTTSRVDLGFPQTR